MREDFRPELLLVAPRVDLRPEDLRPEDLRADDLLLLFELLPELLPELPVRAASFRGDERLRVELFRADVLRDELFLDARLRAGTLSPSSRASLMPIASACLRLVTLRPPRVLSVPRLRRRIALPTVALAFLPYFLPEDFRLDLRAAI